MMRFIKRLLKDAANGENIEFVVLLPVAVLTVVISVFGLVSSTWIASVSLAILTVIASGILGNRYRLEDITKRLPVRLSEPILRDFPTDQIRSSIERASEIWLFGVHITPALDYHRAALEDRLRCGKIIRVLTVDPNGHAVQMTARRALGLPSVERERANILANLNDLSELRTDHPQTLEIRTIDDAIWFNGYLLNPENSDGIIYLRRYTYQAGFTPKFTYRKDGDKELFDLIKLEINSLWNRGSPWSG